MKTRASVVGVLLALISIGTFGQTTPNIIPPSPVSREFAKYVHQQVALYNGIPQIDIPLYEIKLKGLTIPISLSYHASGVKFAQIDGSVGVGWALNPDYRISRTIYGYADETQPMASNALTTVNNFEANGDRLARDGFLSKFIPDVPLDFGSAYDGMLDGEFDQFVFSVPTASGDFIVTDRVNRTATTIEESNLRIDYKEADSQCPDVDNFSITGLRIIDDAGIRYTFGDYNPQTECHMETTSSVYGPYVPTAWGLSEIVTPVGEEVVFNYERREAWNKWTNHVRSYAISETSQDNCFIDTTTPLEGEDIYQGPGYNTFYPEEIVTPNERIVFQYNGDAPEAIFPRKLNNIQIKALDGNILKTIEFFYSYNSLHIFLDHVAIYDSDHNEMETYQFDYYSENTTATFTADQNGYYLQTSSPARFYNQEFMDDPILENEVQETYDGQDCSLNTATLSEYLPGLGISREPGAVPDYFSLKRISYPTGGYVEYKYEHGRYGVEGAERKAGIRIKTITSSDLSGSESVSRSYTYGNNYNGHIENGIGVCEIWITPDYFVNEKMAWWHGCFYSAITGLPTYCDYFPRRMITYATTIQGDIGTALGHSSLVKYPCVTEYHSKYVPSNGYPLSEKSGGRTVYFFNTGNTFDVHGFAAVTQVPREEYAGTHRYVDRYRFWDKPRLERRVDYALIDGLYVEQQETVFGYEEHSSSYTGLKVVQSVVRNKVEVIDNNNFGVERHFNYGGYTIEVGKNVLRHKTEHQYRNGEKVTTAYSYDYNNLLISKETTSRSTGDNTVVYTSYPQDYAPGTTFIDDMTTGNLLAYPIERVKYLENGTDRRILSAQINKYKTGGKGLTDEELVFEADTPIPLNSFKFSNRETGVLPPDGTKTSFLPDENYATRVSYDAYDLHGNPVSATKDGFTTSYLWGYNHVYPICRADNAIYDDTGIDNSSGPTVYTRVNEVLHENFEEHQWRTGSPTAHTGRHIYYGTYQVELRDKIPGNYILTYWSSADGVTWARHDVEISVSTASTVYAIGGATTFLDDIRFHPDDAQMSTFTYDPLIGMTSQTDPAGTVIYYEYDAFGRLTLVKDHKGNVLKQVKYKYKG